MGSDAKRKMGFNATWSMAVGGMIGGGIFSVLGVVVKAAAQWAWLSFVVAGLIALASAYSYSHLTKKIGRSGGSFAFLLSIGQDKFAGSLSWILILGYVLTISVYAFTIGHYLAEALSLGAWFPRICALTVIGIFTFINLRGVGDSSKVEIVTVWGKLFVLLGLAAIGLYHWAPKQLTDGVEPRNITDALMGAAAIFMAYEGFQLLTYDYKEIEDAPNTLPRASLLAVLSVIVVYVLVGLGAVMLVGAGVVVEQKEVALSVAGEKALGTWGMVLVTIAAAFSTGSAINATLFSTARLMKNVAEHRDLPGIIEHKNEQGVPDYAVLAIAVAGGVLAAIGSLSTLVEAASLVFLFTFGVVNFIAFRQKIKPRWISNSGAIGAGAAIAVASWQLLQRKPLSLLLLVAMIAGAVLGHRYFLKKKE